MSSKISKKTNESNSETEEESPLNDVVFNKYKSAGEAANKSIAMIAAQCTEGVSVRSICVKGDEIMKEELKKSFKKETIKKGIAFPTCVSVNNCVCHFNPLSDEPDVVLKNGDFVKIDMACHIDGFIAPVATTVVVGATKENKITGKKADLIMAAHNALEAALRHLKPNEDNHKITEVIQKVASNYNLKPVEGMLSHQLRRWIIDGDKYIMQNPNENQKKQYKKDSFEKFEVYYLDVFITTGDGKTREGDEKVNIFKRTDTSYLLKLKASREFLSTSQKFDKFPFHLRDLSNELTKHRLGLKECLSHGLFNPYNVIYDKENELVAQFKCTVALMNNGLVKLTNHLFDPELVCCTTQLDPSFSALIDQALVTKSKKENIKESQDSTQVNSPE